MSAGLLPGMLRRIRRTADLSQRELAEVCEVSQSLIAHAESGRSDLLVALVARAAAVAGLRLALVDAAGAEVAPMSDDAVRDTVGRHFPAHLDTRYSEEAWWHGRERYSRRQPWYTFDRRRATRDHYRGRDGTPADHQLPQPGDAPEDRRAARRRAALRRLAQARAERLRLGLGPAMPPWVCDCPPGCAALEVWSGPPRHVEGCPCGCDPC